MNTCWYEKYKAARAEYKRKIIESKRDSWRNFCESADSSKEIADLFRCTESRPSGLMSLLSQNNNDSSTPGEAVDILLKAHFPDMSVGGKGKPKEPTEERENRNGEINETEGLINFINTEKVTAALRTFKNMKAPGPDGLKPIVLKNLDRRSKEFLTKLYKLSIKLHRVPKCWKEMNVVFIPKPGKDDYTSPKAYRPITLSSFVLKGLERIVLWYLKENILEERLVAQHAYTKGLSTETALTEAVDYIEKSFYRGKLTVAASLDCTGAFDCVSYRSMREALDKQGTPQNIVEWYDSLLKTRQ